MSSLPAPPVLLELSHRLHGIVEWLCRRGLASHAARARHSGPLMMLTWNRLQRIAARLQTLVALLNAGRPPRVYPPRPPRPPRTPEAAPAPAPANPPLRLPRGVGWLMREAHRTGTGHDIAAYASQLRHWLADPAALALLAEVPRARRILAPLCRMLAVPPWPHPPDGPLPPPKRYPRKPRPRKPRRETLAELRASVWHHRCIETDDGLVRPGKRPWWMPTLRQLRRDG